MILLPEKVDDPKCVLGYCFCYTWQSFLSNFDYTPKPPCSKEHSYVIRSDLKGSTSLASLSWERANTALCVFWGHFLTKYRNAHRNLKTLYRNCRQSCEDQLIGFLQYLSISCLFHCQKQLMSKNVFCVYFLLPNSLTQIHKIQENWWQKLGPWEIIKLNPHPVCFWQLKQYLAMYEFWGETFAPNLRNFPEVLVTI